MSGLIPRLKQPPHVFRLKEHLSVRDDYECKGNSSYEEIDHIHGIHHESRLVRPLDEYEREMPERPQRAIKRTWRQTSLAN